MNNQEREAILTIALMAAFADGNNATQERDEIKRIVEALGAENNVNTAVIYQNVLLKKATLADTISKANFSSPDMKTLAYEFAVGVCDADGAHSAAEKSFLDSLQQHLAIDASAAATLNTQAAALAVAPVAVSTMNSESTIEPKYASTMTEAELDKMVLNYAILNGALELLPQSLASMAIIPLQMKMVYRIGKAHGFDLDKGHIKDFLGTLGVGLTSQYVEQFGRKLMGGLLGKVAGGIGRSIGSAGTGAAFSFATTYALGHVAKKYYAGGRSLSTETMKEAFSGVLGEAKQLQTKYLPDIQQKARTLDISQVMKEVAR
jgi:uncharacterized protein (DUF697 family)/tellurite resistance protein